EPREERVRGLFFLFDLEGRNKKDHEAKKREFGDGGKDKRPAKIPRYGEEGKEVPEDRRKRILPESKRGEQEDDPAVGPAQVRVRTHGHADKGSRSLKTVAGKAVQRERCHRDQRTEQHGERDDGPEQVLRPHGDMGFFGSRGGPDFIVHRSTGASHEV